MSCLCTPDFPECLLAPDIEFTNQEESLYNDFSAVVEFEPTAIGKTRKKIIRIQNNCEFDHVYSIRRDRIANPIYRVFEMKFIEATVGPGLYLQCIVVYNPQLPNEKNVEYIEIVDDESKIYKMCLRGECIGPHVVASMKDLFFYNQEVVKTFELRNTHDVSVFYHFDVNESREEEPVFRLDNVRGVLEPLQHTFVRVVFVPRAMGIYSQSLVCLITHHPPIIIELVGIHTTADYDCNLPNSALRKYSMETEDCEGYGGFMYDSLNTAFHKPSFTLSVNYLNFGGTQAKKSSTLTTSLTNHMSKDIEVIWENDNTTNFTIIPKEIVIPAGESVLYECQYHPAVADQVHSTIVRGYVHWSNMKKTLMEAVFIEQVDVPLSITLRFAGHSFPKNRGWIPNVDVDPISVAVPPAMPSVPSYTMMLLKAGGDLPTMFEFLPPEKSNFLVKPMTGIIREFQIVVVQLQPNSIDKTAYRERWNVQFNGREDSIVPLCLQGYSEYAKIVVGVLDVVKFRTTFPGCQDISSVMVQNIGCHFLEYEFETEEGSNLEIDHPKGEIASNERIFLKWYAMGNLKAPELAIVKCHVQTVQNTKILLGCALDHHVRMYTKCAYSELCATPKNVDLETVRWGDTVGAAFRMFNFGESAVHFKLSADNENLEEDELTIFPTKGSVYPRDSVEVRVNLKVYKTGHEELKLVYRVRLNELSEVLIDEEKRYDVFRIKYYGTYPTLQIEDLVGSNFGYLFSKVILWDLFNIDGINKILREIEHDQTATAEFFLPDYELGEADFSGTLILRNVTPFDTELDIKREHVCDCKFRYISKGISFRQKFWDCLHRKMFKFTLSENQFMANNSQNLQFDVKYLEYGLTRYMYTLNLCDNRTVRLYVNINVLPAVVTKASIYSQSFDLNLKPVFIGEMEPSAQVFPMYNNSEFEVSYKLDDVALLRINFDYDFEIFKCINPEGTLAPFTTKDILFKFTPIEVRRYEVVAELTMGKETFLLQINGEGIATFDSTFGKAENKMPCSSKSQINNVIELSVDHLVVEPFPVWSTVDKMIFIRNQTTDRIIGYSWQSCAVEGTVKAEVAYNRGVLKPKEFHSVIIKLTSFDRPCQLRLQMACKLLDHTQHIAHKESVLNYDLKEQELEGQFTITESGITYPKNPLVIEPKAIPFFTTFSLSVCVTSIPDRDLHATREKALAQSPQYTLRVNTLDIFNSYITKRLSDNPQLRGEIVKKIMQKSRLTETNTATIKMEDHEVKMFKNVMECLMGDAVFSNWFDTVMDITNKSNQPYYAQVKLNDEAGPIGFREEEEMQQCLKKRLEVVDHFLNKPQTPILTGVYRELIADSVHEIFQLGPQVKDVSKKTHLYHSAMQRFTCSTCKCDDNLENVEASR